MFSIYILLIYLFIYLFIIIIIIIISAQGISDTESDEAPRHIIILVFSYCFFFLLFHRCYHILW